MEQVKGLIAQLGAKRLIIMGGVAALIMAALAMVALRGENTTMGFLYTDLDPSAAAAISEKLKSQNVPFELSADGTAVPYGGTWTSPSGDFTCESAEDGITCENQSGNGFFLNRDDYEGF